MSCACCYGDVCETDLISPSPLSSWRQWYDGLTLDQRFEIYLFIEDYVSCTVEVPRDEVDALDYDADADWDSFTDSYFGMDSLAETDSFTAFDNDSDTASNWDSDTASDWDSDTAAGETHVKVDDIVFDQDSETVFVADFETDFEANLAKEDDEFRLMSEWFEKVGVEMTKEMVVPDDNDSWVQGEESEDESEFDDADDEGYDDRTSDEKRGFSKDPYSLATY